MAYDMPPIKKWGRRPQGGQRLIWWCGNGTKRSRLMWMELDEREREGRGGAADPGRDPTTVATE
jgi:hypothetical protein